jgi:hypothetical protein
MRCQLAKHPIDRRPTDLETLGDVRCTEALISEDTHLLWVDAGLTALVDARCLGLADTLHLTLAPKVGLELREDPEHVEEAFPAAVLVSMGCSVALSDAPLALIALTMS